MWLSTVLKWALVPSVHEEHLGAQDPPVGEPRPLHEAVIAGDEALVRSLLTRGCPLNTLNGCGDAALHLAAALPSPEITEALLAAGADPNARNKYFGDTPLLAAVLAQQLGSVEALLAAGANTQLPGRKGDLRPEALWKHGANAAALTRLAAGAATHTPLHHAATAGHLPITRALLRGGAAFSPEEQGRLDQELRRAAVMLKLDAVRALRAAGARLGSACSETLYAQAWGGDVAAVQCWVAAGAALDDAMLARGSTELLEGVLAADLPRLQRWLAAGVDPSAVRDGSGRSALALAAALPGVARVLCEAPLQLAAELGQAASLQAMLAVGGAAALGPDARARLLAAALGAGVRGDWLAVLLPGQAYVPEADLRRWVEAAGAYAGPTQGLPWARASLMALSSWGLHGDVAHRVLAFAVVV